MEGVYALGAVMAIAVAIVIILAIKTNAATITLSALLFVGAVIVHVTPIFPVTVAKTSGQPLSFILAGIFIGAGVIALVALALCRIRNRTNETIFGWMIIGWALLVGAHLGRKCHWSTYVQPHRVRTRRRRIYIRYTVLRRILWCHLRTV